MPAMALLDRDGVYGAPQFHIAAKKAGIAAHIGAELTSADGAAYPLPGRIPARLSKHLPSHHSDETARAKGEGSIEKNTNSKNSPMA